jgi:hypothetical protein
MNDFKIQRSKSGLVVTRCKTSDNPPLQRKKSLLSMTPGLITQANSPVKNNYFLKTQFLKTRLSANKFQTQGSINLARPSVHKTNDMISQASNPFLSKMSLFPVSNIRSLSKMEMTIQTKKSNTEMNSIGSIGKIEMAYERLMNFTEKERAFYLEYWKRKLKRIENWNSAEIQKKEVMVKNLISIYSIRRFETCNFKELDFIETASKKIKRMNLNLAILTINHKKAVIKEISYNSFDFLRNLVFKQDYPLTFHSISFDFKALENVECSALQTDLILYKLIKTICDRELLFEKMIDTFELDFKSFSEVIMATSNHSQLTSIKEKLKSSLKYANLNIKSNTTSHNIEEKLKFKNAFDEYYRKRIDYQLLCVRFSWLFYQIYMRLHQKEKALTLIIKSLEQNLDTICVYIDFYVKYYKVYEFLMRYLITDFNCQLNFEANDEIYKQPGLTYFELLNEIIDPKKRIKYVNSVFIKLSKIFSITELEYMLMTICEHALKSQMFDFSRRLVLYLIGIFENIDLFQIFQSEQGQLDNLEKKDFKTERVFKLLKFNQKKTLLNNYIIECSIQMKEYEDALVYIVNNYFIYKNSLREIDESDPQKYFKKNVNEIMMKTFESGVDPQHQLLFKEIISFFQKSINISFEYLRTIVNTLEFNRGRKEQGLYLSAKDLIPRLDKSAEFDKEHYDTIISPFRVKNQASPNLRINFHMPVPFYVGVFNRNEYLKYIFSKINLENERNKGKISDLNNKKKTLNDFFQIEKTEQFQKETQSSKLKTEKLISKEDCFLFLNIRCEEICILDVLLNFNIYLLRKLQLKLDYKSNYVRFQLRNFSSQSKQILLAHFKGFWRMLNEKKIIGSYKIEEIKFKTRNNLTKPEFLQFKNKELNRVSICLINKNHFNVSLDKQIVSKFAFECQRKCSQVTSSQCFSFLPSQLSHFMKFRFLKWKTETTKLLPSDKRDSIKQEESDDFIKRERQIKKSHSSQKLKTENRLDSEINRQKISINFSQQLFLGVISLGKKYLENNNFIKSRNSKKFKGKEDFREKEFDKFQTTQFLNQNLEIHEDDYIDPEYSLKKITQNYFLFSELRLIQYYKLGLRFIKTQTHLILQINFFRNKYYDDPILLNIKFEFTEPLSSIYQKMIQESKQKFYTIVPVLHKFLLTNYFNSILYDRSKSELKSNQSSLKVYDMLKKMGFVYSLIYLKNDKNSPKYLKTVNLGLFNLLDLRYLRAFFYIIKYLITFFNKILMRNQNGIRSSTTIEFSEIANDEDFSKSILNNYLRGVLVERIMFYYLQIGLKRKRKYFSSFIHENYSFSTTIDCDGSPNTILQQIFQNLIQNLNFEKLLNRKKSKNQKVVKFLTSKKLFKISDEFVFCHTKIGFDNQILFHVKNQMENGEFERHIRSMEGVVPQDSILSLYLLTISKNLISFQFEFSFAFDLNTNQTYEPKNDKYRTAENSKFKRTLNIHEMLIFMLLSENELNKMTLEKKIKMVQNRMFEINELLLWIVVFPFDFKKHAILIDSFFKRVDFLKYINKHSNPAKEPGEESDKLYFDVDQFQIANKENFDVWEILIHRMFKSKDSSNFVSVFKPKIIKTLFSEVDMEEIIKKQRVSEYSKLVQNINTVYLKKQALWENSKAQDVIKNRLNLKHNKSLLVNRLSRKSDFKMQLPVPIENLNLPNPGFSLAPVKKTTMAKGKTKINFKTRTDSVFSEFNKKKTIQSSKLQYQDQRQLDVQSVLNDQEHFRYFLSQKNRTSECHFSVDNNNLFSICKYYGEGCLRISGRLLDHHKNNFIETKWSGEYIFDKLFDYCLIHYKSFQMKDQSQLYLDNSDYFYLIKALSSDDEFHQKCILSALSSSISHGIDKIKKYSAEQELPFEKTLPQQLFQDNRTTVYCDDQLDYTMHKDMRLIRYLNLLNIRDFDSNISNTQLQCFLLQISPSNLNFLKSHLMYDYSIFRICKNIKSTGKCFCEIEIILSNSNRWLNRIGFLLQEIKSLSDIPLKNQNLTFTSNFPKIFSEFLYLSVIYKLLRTNSTIEEGLSIFSESEVVYVKIRVTPFSCRYHSNIFLLNRIDLNQLLTLFLQNMFFKKKNKQKMKMMMSKNHVKLFINFVDFCMDRFETIETLQFSKLHLKLQKKMEMLCFYQNSFFSEKPKVQDSFLKQKSANVIHFGKLIVRFDSQFLIFSLSYKKNEKMFELQAYNPKSIRRGVFVVKPKNITLTLNRIINFCLFYILSNKMEFLIKPIFDDAQYRTYKNQVILQFVNMFKEFRNTKKLDLDTDDIKFPLIKKPPFNRTYEIDLAKELSHNLKGLQTCFKIETIQSIISEVLFKTFHTRKYFKGCYSSDRLRARLTRKNKVFKKQQLRPMLIKQVSNRFEDNQIEMYNSDKFNYNFGILSKVFQKILSHEILKNIKLEHTPEKVQLVLEVLDSRIGIDFQELMFSEQKIANNFEYSTQSIIDIKHDSTRRENDDQKLEYPFLLLGYPVFYYNDSANFDYEIRIVSKSCFGNTPKLYEFFERRFKLRDIINVYLSTNDRVSEHSSMLTSLKLSFLLKISSFIVRNIFEYKDYNFIEYEGTDITTKVKKY